VTGLLRLDSNYELAVVAALHGFLPKSRDGIVYCNASAWQTALS
jgi:hypothetical protein